LKVGLNLARAWARVRPTKLVALALGLELGLELELGLAWL